MTTIDDIGVRAGEAARTEAQAMARSLVDSGLRQLRDGEGAVVATPSRDPRPRRWAAFAAAVALAAAAVVAIVVYANNGREKAVVPATDVTTPTNLPPTTTPLTTIPPDTTADTTPATTVPQVVPDNAISVSYADLPPAYAAPAFATVDGGVMPLIAIGDSSIVVVQDSTATMFDLYSGTPLGDPVHLQASPVESIAAGPGDVMYAFFESSGPMKVGAIALAGDRAGEVLEQADVSRPPIAPTGSLTNIGALGHGPDGIVDRGSGQRLLPYVDPSGAPATLGRPAHMVVTVSGAPAETGVMLVVDPDGDHDWQLHLLTAPSWDVSLAEGTGRPYPSSRGGAVLWTPIDDGHTVLAVLAADGSGEWYSLTDGWQVAASDTTGTILARVANGKVELAKLDPPQRLDFLDQPLGLNERVAYAETKPTSLSSAPPCTLDQLKLEPSVDGAMGTAYGVLWVRNQIDTACTVSGVPDVAFLDDAGNVVQSTDPSTLGTPGNPLILEHDSWAMSELGAIASNVCGGNQSSQFRLTLGGTSTTVPLAIGGPVDPYSCTPPQGQSSVPGALTPQPFTVVPPNDGGFNPFDGVQVSINAPGSVKAGETLHYDVIISTEGEQQSMVDPFCPIYTETLANASGQYLLNCNGSDGVLITHGDPVVFHIELPIPPDATPGDATLTWTPVEPAAPAVTAIVTILA